ncbi:hypothetical protein GCM10010885_10560 [Alicyclobacillus cellulosilyticus]|uniref:Uncharacterized protein n=1 Tax=Alicyclobacillus cellulosilyticus TaxID=1003997 RepID=A0A917NJU3_9BACL|nr:hypothetical protein [Alicyclobacillus cellulosilyticus]GGJ03157.1 hypothetical protein GCM10010885_10560 [Alicyclobacillus cellulosilyticus]
MMYAGQFGPYTRWAVVFLIIFVLFFLLCPGHAVFTAAPSGPAMAAYTHPAPHYGVMHYPGTPPMGGGMMMHGYESPSSP